MKWEFERTLRDYGDVAKDKAAVGLTEVEEDRLDKALDWLIEKNSDRTGTTAESHLAVFEYQKKKQAIMSQLKEDLRGLDGLEIREGQVPVAFKGGKYRIKDGQEITLGQLMTDGEWGIDYFCDPASVPRQVRKRLLLEQAKRELMAYLDKQIVEFESSKSWLDKTKREAYLRMKEQDTSRSGGHNAEKMVSNFLRKLMYDQDAGFKVLEADAYQDMEQKVDFIIRMPQANRGVGVEEDPQAIGIQFTINDQPLVVENKSRQVAKARRHLRPEDKLKDIVLVVLPLASVSRKVNEWRKHMKPGGPDQDWDAQTKEKILRSILKGLLSEAEMERLCSTFRPPTKPAAKRPLPDNPFQRV